MKILNIVVITGVFVPYRYGQQSRIMTGCQNISKPFCDLSSEMMDIRSKYFVKIIADELCLGEITHFIPLEKSKTKI